MEIQQLRYFVLASHRASFKAAADELFVSRTALSKSVSKLEGELGYALFDRTRDGVCLTSAGRRFLEKAGPVVAAYDELEQTVLDERRHAIVSLGIPVSWTEAFTGAIDRFAQARPDVRVVVSNWSDVECVRKARAGELDVVVSHLPVPDMLDEGKLLVCAPLYIAMNEKCPLASRDVVMREDLASYDIVYYACGYNSLAWAPAIGGLSEAYDNDMMHIYARLYRNEVVFPTPLWTVPDRHEGLVFRRYRGILDMVVMTGYIALSVKGKPLLEQACRDLRDALVLDVDGTGSPIPREAVRLREVEPG